MGIFQADLVARSAILESLADLRKNTFLMDDALSHLLDDPYLQKVYGKKEIDNFKKFLTTRNIMVAIEHRPQDQASFPAIVVKLGPGDEDGPKDALGDGFQQENVDPSTLGGVFKYPQIVAGPLTPEAYDVLTGQISFADGVVLSNVFEDQMVYDEINRKSYPIKLVLGDSEIMIEENLSPPPNLTGMTIRTIQNQVGHIRRSLFVWEKVELEILATTGQEVIYLFTILMYALIRYKKPLWDARNFQVSSITYSDLYHATPQADPNVIYGRTISMRGRVEQSAIESTSELLQGLSLDLRVADMETPDSIEEQVESQGWSGENDE